MSDTLTRILKQNWPHYSHQKLYDMVRTEAAGVSVLSGADRAWAEFHTVMAESRQKIDDLLREAGACWEGIAADSMQAGVTPLAQWADDAGTAAQASGNGLRQVGDSFSYTAHAMPEPLHPAVNARFANVFAGMIDQDRQEREAQEVKQRAVELMQRYSTNAHSAVNSLGVFVPPQDVTVQPVMPETSGGSPVQYSGTAIVTAPPGPGRSSGPSTPDPGQPREERAPVERSESIPVSTTESAAQSPAATSPAGGPAATTTASTAAGTVAPIQQTTGGFPTGTGVSTGSRATRPPDGLPDRPVPGPGAGAVGGGRQAGGAVRAPGAKIAARAGAIGTGPMMAPAAAVRREEDKEHVSPEYLQAYHDEFWDASPPASPPVIGEDPPEG